MSNIKVTMPIEALDAFGTGGEHDYQLSHVDDTGDVIKLTPPDGEGITIQFNVSELLRARQIVLDLTDTL